MSVKDKQARVLTLFKHLTSFSKAEILPADRDPRLGHVGHLHQGELFSCFHEEDLAEATELYETLHAAKDFEDFMSLAKQARTFVNEGLFAYAVSVAILHRDDCKGVTVPPIQEVFPDRFIPSETIILAVKKVYNNPDQDVEVHVQATGNILDPEYQMTYFREDIGANAHHWHWHIVYPATWRPEVMHKTKDRKGELFYYMHQQMCARYDCERLSNGMRRMIPFHNFEEELDGYSSHLISLVSGLKYASRPDGFSLHDVPDVDVEDMIRWRERLIEAIDKSQIFGDKGKMVPLSPENGIDVLGSLVESSYESPNKRYYGSLHNWGHVMMANLADPDGRFNENPGVMSDTSTSLRDPIFYRYHRFIDNLFQEYKATLPSYKKEDMDFAGVEVVGVNVQAKVQNLITTFMKDDALELTHGIDLGTSKSVKVIYQHLDHEPFTYKIQVENKGEAKKATVRIFLGPKYDELGNRLSPESQRGLCIELDKFVVDLNAGKTTFERDHRLSSVTVTETHTFKQLEAGEGVSESTTEFCSCGWPEHMLIPRGNYKGMEFDLFVMLTDHAADSVNGGLEGGVCTDAVSYCGAKDGKYPDKKPMGFPFDRVIEALTMPDFLTPNMSCTDLRIKFQG